MGIGFSYIQKMDALGLFREGRVKVLDIGSSNLYTATPDEIKGFLRKYGARTIASIDEFAERLASGSGYDPVSGGRNESFVGELFEKAGMEYLAFDIADGYRTRILDLNHAVLPKELQGHFDLVLNFGTTEHILNQYNCFKVIHEATRVGGFIHHSLPGVGYADHGYITYTARCFFDIAGYNEYEVVDFWLDGPGGSNDVLQSLRSYSGYFPALKRVLENIERSPQGSALKAAAVPDIGLNVVFRKVKDRPFWGALESSTSVGAIPRNVTASYQSSAESSPAIDINTSERSSGAGAVAPLKDRIAGALRSYPLLYNVARRAYRGVAGKDGESPKVAATADLTDEERTLRDKLLGGSASLDEGLRLYSLMTARGQTFPIAWEELTLRLSLKADPTRADLLGRLRQVLNAQGKPVDADVEARFAAHAAAEERAQDHQKAAAGYHAATGTADMDEAFLPIYERCRAYSMTSADRMYALYKAVQYLEDARIEGDIVECGVWRGGSMMIVAHTLLARGSTDRNLYLFDTFEGLPRPDASKDIDIWGNRAIDGWLPYSAGEEKSHWAEAGLEEVRTNLVSTGYPDARLHFVKGMVERTIPAEAPRRIALLRLDTDWYASTKHELEHLFDRLSRNGVLIIDDYGHFKGARKAVDEFIADRRVPILLNRIDYTGRLAIKVTD